MTPGGCAGFLPGAMKGWLCFQNYDGGAEWLDRRLLDSLLPKDGFEACIQPRCDDSRCLRLLNRQEHLESLAWTGCSWPKALAATDASVPATADSYRRIG